MLNDLEFTKEIFERLQNVAKVTHFEEIFPWYVDNLINSSKHLLT